MNPRVYTLPPRLTLDCAANLREEWLALAAETAPLELDGAAVEQAETAGLQLLLALARSRREAGQDLHWRSASAPLHKAAEILGLSATMGLPPATEHGAHS